MAEVVYQGKTHSTRGAVREVLRHLKKASVRQIREILGLTDAKGGDRVYRALRGLMRDGWAKRVNEGIYAYREATYKAPKTLGKIWRAIRCSQRFTKKDIILLTGADDSYIKGYIRQLINEGYLVLVGKKDKQHLYQITAKATPGVPPYGKKQRIKRDDSRRQLEEAIWEMVRAVVAANGQPKYVTVNIVRDKASKILELTAESAENR
jgi:predicted transcriptional regulator